MKILYLLKTEPDKDTRTLMEVLSEEGEITIFPLYDEHADYEKLLDMIFQHDRVISWW